MSFRAYFSFDYEDPDDFRIDVVRNHKFLGDIEKAGYFGTSPWIPSKKNDTSALKRLIDAELQGTFATIVLYGDKTHSRRWVRYEMLKSIEQGNALLGIKINGITAKGKKPTPHGPNPLDYVGVLISADGTKGRPTEWDSSKWVMFRDLDEFPISEQPPDLRNKNVQLSHWYKSYDWVSDDGLHHFYSWIT
jgi:hypothetical protein